MNMSDVVRRVRNRLGLAIIPTPFGDTINEQIVEIIENDTLPVFSIYHPFRTKYHIDFKNVQRLPDAPTLGSSVSHSTYLLPENIVENLLYVRDINYCDNSVVTTGYYGIPLGYLGGQSAQDIILGNAAMALGQQMIPKPTFHFERPRTLTIYGQYITSDFILDLEYKHDKSLATIEEPARESFMELALLDVKTGLYPTMKQFTEINTPIGNINLKIDDWADSESKREELLNNWNDRFLLDYLPYYI